MQTRCAHAAAILLQSSPRGFVAWSGNDDLQPFHQNDMRLALWAWHGCLGTQQRHIRCNLWRIAEPAWSRCYVLWHSQRPGPSWGRFWVARASPARLLPRHLWHHITETEMATVISSWYFHPSDVLANIAGKPLQQIWKADMSFCAKIDAFISDTIATTKEDIILPIHCAIPALMTNRIPWQLLTFLS
jgi:hypothetical protein